MGLFNRKKQQPQPQPQPQPAPMPAITVQPWQTKPITKTYRLPAKHEATIFTYNGTPFRGLTANAHFIVTAVPADVQMVSMYTGNITNTSDYDDVAYAYNGQIFGLSSSHGAAIKKMMLNGYQVEVEAYISGFDGNAGFPKIRGLFGYVDDEIFDELQ